MRELMNMLKDAVPLNITKYVMTGKKVGLIIVDEVNGFCKPGCGPLAPPAPDKAISNMIAETDNLASAFINAGHPIFVLMDTHRADVPEPPYPPHCIYGTEEAKLVDQLRYLTNAPNTVVSGKDCIDGFIGTADSYQIPQVEYKLYSSRLAQWINDNELEALVVVGICTDICDMDLVLSLLSARNHGMMPILKDIVVFEPGCATYDLPKKVAVQIGLPEFAAHPREFTQYMGLYFMASRGAILANKLE